ncbi:MAG: phosphate ABC transporter permease subunit PstC [Caldilineaceae bacterium]|nr:phosphate ABC transporter permease subunit PstC [Caldilineaceae bacterium]
MEISRETRVLSQAQARLGGTSRRLGFLRAVKDRLARTLFGWVSLAVCVLVLIITALLAARSWPLLTAYPLGNLLTGQDWHPMRGMFGFAPFIVGSLAVTGVAAAIAVIPAILSGIYLAEYTTTRLRTTLKPLIDLLVGIPSVVYGLWGILFIVPLVRDQLGPWSHQTLGTWIPFFRQTNPSGYGLLSAGFVLAIMVFPLIVAVTDEVMRSVPSAMREATLSLGANRWEATKCVVRHAALPGILAAVVLGFSRAFGETLAVMMLVGNMPQIPRSLFDGAYPLPALIANNYGEMMSVPLYESALMSAALMLLLVILLFNIGARLIIERIGKGR